MIVEKIDTTDGSYSVRETEYDRTWYLVRNADTERPTVISVQYRPGEAVDRHVYLKPTGAKYKRAVKAVRSHGSFRDAVANFEAVQDKYAALGATDTEPRGEFTSMLERILEDRDPQVPTVGQPSYFGGKDNNPWQLYSTMKGAYFANKALTTAARKVVKAAAADRAGLVEYMEYAYGIKPGWSF